MGKHRERIYQADARTSILSEFSGGHTCTIACLPTGTGKTHVAAHVAAEMLAMNPGKRVMAVLHRDELVWQTVAKFGEIVGVPPAVEKAEEWSQEDGLLGKPPVVVSSVQTLNSGAPGRERMRRFDPKDFCLLFVDEFHHGVAATWRRVIEYFTAGNPDLKVLGVTATYDRADGEPLGVVADSCAFNYTLPEAVRDGWLVRVLQRVAYIEGLDISKVSTSRGDLNQIELDQVVAAERALLGIAHAIIEAACDLPRHALRPLLDRPDRTAELRRMLGGRRIRLTLGFAPGVMVALRLAEIVNRWLPGTAGYVAGEGDREKGFMPKDQRRATMAAFSRGEIRFMFNCDVATEGYDEPAVELVAMARPTKSRAKYVQMLGRGTRPAESIASLLGDLPDADARRSLIASSEKPAVLVLDFAGNAGRHKLVSAMDVLGDASADDEVAERARAKVGSDGEAVDASAALAEAEREVGEEQEQARREAAEAQAMADAEELRRTLDAARRAGLVGVASYTVRDVDALDRYDVAPARQAEVTGNGASEKQIKALVDLGVRRETAAAYGARQAGAVIVSMRAKRCSEPQANALYRFGYSPEEVASMNFAAASAAIEAAKANNGRRPPRGAAA